MKKQFTEGTWKAEGLKITCYGAGIVAKCILPSEGGCMHAMGNAKVIARTPQLVETVINLQRRLEMLINATPSGEKRNELTDENIRTLQLINECLGEGN